MDFPRLLNIDRFRSSAFLFGPRMVGKTSLLEKLSPDKLVDLLDPEQNFAYLNNPTLLLGELKALPSGSLVVIDEIQKRPELLDVVQTGIDKLGHRFILSGSSARKLKRINANLLGGRALDLKLYPLTASEIGENFNIRTALQYGTLPKIASLTQVQDSVHEARAILRTYNSIYLREEIQAEALTRNIAAFQRFLLISAESDAKLIEYANIGSDAKVPDSTVKEYFSILEDTLIARFLWPWDRTERKKARPKLYFFDCGVVRAITNRLFDPPTNIELGALFENWFVNEILRLKDYSDIPEEVSFWRDGDAEVDLLVHRGSQFKLAIEIKSGTVSDNDISSLRRFKMKNHRVPVFVASLKTQHEQILPSGIRVLPWKDAISEFEKMFR